MLKPTIATFVAILVLGTLVVGECASCPLTLKTPSNGCCAQHNGGNCNMPQKPQPTDKTCPDQALAPQSYHQIQLGVAHLLPALAVSAPIVLPQPEAPFFAPANDALSGHAPPDLYLLNSVLLV